MTLAEKDVDDDTFVGSPDNLIISVTHENNIAVEYDSGAYPKRCCL